jgi:hypothetical protein
MAAILTKNLKILMAKQIYNLLDLGANSYLPDARKSYIYAFIGRNIAWNSGTEIAPFPTYSEETASDYFRRGSFAKQVSLENASLVVERINWSSNTVYNTYNSSGNFYVLNSRDQIFKCLSNVSVGTASTSEPVLTLSTTSLEEPYVQTADGYKWKYMYTLTSAQKQKFLSNDWMPVTFNKFVRAAAVGGSIDIVNITNSGNNYTDGTTQDIITITGDGAGAVLRANVSGGQIRDIIIQSRGENYTFADLTISDVAGGVGIGATASVSISPSQGHGYDPVYELGATTIMFNVEFDRDEGGSLPTDNEFREVILLQNPIDSLTGASANSASYTLYTKVKVSPGVGDFNNDEIVYQGATYDERTFSAEVISFDEVQNLLYLNNVRGTIQSNQAIKGYNTGSIRVVNSITSPTLDLYSGKILYISDNLPITRDPAQTERIRFILSF